MSRTHSYKALVEWTGNEGQGTRAYAAYRRDHVISIAGKSADIAGSSDPSFRGDTTRYNPEELLVSSLSACHMLWYLGLCAGAGVVVTAYADSAEGVMEEEAGGAGQFTCVVLRPHVTLTSDSDVDKARALHADAHAKCFIARSVNFPVLCEPVFSADDDAR
ncbi:OsmC family protein [Sphingomonas sp. C3-2]|uniref:OsmC family protein n=1 Tax=Sphingomonas sp. C3-2 TaxID=3062169 RepID=UPI00294AEC01|nr:OsmC family protein [Sphingomonas sp. C3-2]WOK37628.1 OsmC family protein [Sphingomonas sp. C3-2]